MIKYVSVNGLVEFLIMSGLLLIWISMLILVLVLGSYPEILRQAAANKQGLEQTTGGEIMFLVGDGMFMLCSMFALYRYRGEDKMSWTMLFLGLLFSIHLPLIVRSWIYRMFDFYSGQERDNNALIQPVLATAVATALGMALSLTSILSVNAFNHPRISQKYRIIFKTLIGLGLLFGQLFVPIGIVQYRSVRETSASTVFLFMSPVLVAAGYIPGRIMMLLKEEYNDSDDLEPLINT
jgi:hypothetical protein